MYLSNLGTDLCTKSFTGTIDLFGVMPEFIYPVKYHAVVDLGISKFNNQAILLRTYWWIQDEKILREKFWKPLVLILNGPVINQILEKLEKIYKKRGLILIDPQSC